MENNVMEPKVKAAVKQVITPAELLNHWQGHRRLTRRTIEAFPEEQLFTYSVGGMRPFAVMVNEMMGLSAAGIKGIVTGEWISVKELDYLSGKSAATTKEELLAQWDTVTDEIDNCWAQLLPEQFHENILAFNTWEGETYAMVLYWIDNEIHHRAQGYVYLRSLGIEPPAFWNRA